MTTKERIQELRSTAEMREDLYRVLSALFLSAPSDELLQEVLSDEFLNAIQAVFGNDVADHLRRSAATRDRDPVKLEQEFNDLFVVPAGKYVAPYESAFREKRVTEERELPGLLMGKPSEQVLASYAEMGLSPAGGALGIAERPRGRAH